MPNAVENTPLLDNSLDFEAWERKDTILPLYDSNNHDGRALNSLKSGKSTLLTPSFRQMKDLKEAEIKNNAKEVQKNKQKKRLLVYDSSVR